MESQVTNNANALRLFFTEDVFLVEDKSVEIVPDVALKAVLTKPAVYPNDTTEVLSIVEIDQNQHEKLTEIQKSSSPDAEIRLAGRETVLSKSFRFLGGNKKFVLLLVNDKNNEVSTEQGRELLRKIVKAIDLSTPDFALLNYAQHEGTTYTELQQFFKPQLMLAFGIESGHLNLNLVWENEILIHEATKMIFAPNLHDLDGNLAEKKALWSHLQKIK